MSRKCIALVDVLVSENLPVRLAALPLNIPPRIALKGFSGPVIAVLDEVDHCVHLPPGTKKRRIALIVVWWNQSVFQLLMLLDYQIRLDLASEVVLMDVDEWA